jgi:hypothetical protein
VAALQLAVQKLGGPAPDYDLQDVVDDLRDDLRGIGPGPDPLLLIRAGNQNILLLQSVKEAAAAALVLLKEAVQQQQQQQQQVGYVCGTLEAMAAELAALLQQQQ